MHDFEIRLADKFPEPAFTLLQRQVFADVQLASDALRAVFQEEAQTGPIPNEARSPMIRFGAYAGTELVGWSCGWMERGATFYMATSGVIASRRRQGLYTSLLCKIREYAIANGASILRSQHSVLNNAVIIAKLREGFIISGLSLSAQMGTLVELVCHVGEGRRQMFAQRAVPYVESRE